MYIGGVEEGENTVFILQDNKIIEKTILYPPGLYKIFDELIVNAYDQTIRDHTLSNIKVDIDQSKNIITVFNDGKGIDVVLHPTEKIYVPELIFSHLLTSTTFDDKGKPRITGGVHGLGAKLTAIFSKYFKVEVGDSVHKKKFVQYYKNNLSFKSNPIISDYDKPKGYVKITFQPDLKYFGLKEMSADLIYLFKRRVYDISALTKSYVKVSLNGEKLPVNKFEDYVSMFTDSPQIKENCDNKIAEFKDGRWNIIVTKSNGRFNQVSFVNGIYTSNGGYHVTYITNKIVKEVKKVVKTKMVKDQFIKDQIWIGLARRKQG
jgi:DNA topoisomerase-2